MDSCPLPKELEQPTPRCVKMRGGTIGMIILLNVVYFWFMAQFTLMAYSFAHKDAILKERGVPIDGTVIDMQSEPGKGGPNYYVSYTFKPPEASPSHPIIYQYHQIIAGYDYQRLHANKTVPVLYDPLDPDVASTNFNDRLHKTDPYGYMRRMLPVLLGLPSILYVILSAVLYWYYFKEKTLIMYGRIARAVITKEKEMNSGRTRYTVVTYHFTDSDGKLIEGTRSNLPTKSQRERAEASMQFYKDVTEHPIVLYDPASSSRNMLYPGTLMLCCVPGPKIDKI
jgi:hypothetical protein